MNSRRTNTSKQKPIRWRRKGLDVKPYLNGHSRTLKPFFTTASGALFEGDCLDVLPLIEDGVVDTVFADPPFNLGKEYGSRSNDNLAESEYLEWCKAWIAECTRTLKNGGAFFLYNLPKWNVLLGSYLSEIGLEFRHWIAVEISACLPIPGRLHPSHYSLLYYTKGKPQTFRRIRTPIQICRHCGGEVKDYGGHRNAMNPKGVNLKDVWTDIPPVRHSKFKSAARKANALSTKLVGRVVELSTQEGDTVLDPFGGSGTTFAVCEQKKRRWLGVELDFCPVIVERLETEQIAAHKCEDVVDAD